MRTLTYFAWFFDSTSSILFTPYFAGVRGQCWLESEVSDSINVERSVDEVIIGQCDYLSDAEVPDRCESLSPSSERTCFYCAILCLFSIIFCNFWPIFEAFLICFSIVLA